MNNLTELLGQHTPLRRAASTDGGEWHGPCPFCGGRDRFHVWPQPARTKPHYWCRQCEQRGDAIQFARDYLRLNFAEAQRWAGEPRLPGPAPAREPVVPDVVMPPPAVWQARAEALVAYAEGQLWGDAGAGMRAHLFASGLTEKTLRAARVGWNPRRVQDSRARWGLEPRTNRWGKPEPVWIPRGIVFPTWDAGTLWRVFVRRPNRDLQDGDTRKYIMVAPAPGATVVLEGADTIAPGRPALLVEGPRDRLAAWQEAGDVLSVVAAGTTTGARRPHWLMRLALAEPVLLAFDADEGGDNAAVWWQQTLPSARRWRPLLKDVADMLAAGMDVREWALAGLGTG